MNEKTTREIAAELQKYPEKSTLHWGDMHAKINKNLHRASWIDVYVPELCDKLGYSWLVTILDPENYDEETEQAWPIHPESSLILAKPSGTIWTLWNSAKMDYDEEVLIIKNYKETPNTDELSLLETKAESDTSTICEVAYWTSEDINNVLQKWTHAQSGRSDITFSYLDTIGEKLVKDLEEKIKNQEMFTISENIEVTSDTFQKLLELPSEEAADIIKKVKEATQYFKENQ